MGRFGRILFAVAVLAAIATWAACGSNPTRVTAFPVPANVTLSPGGIVSMDLGTTETFIGAAENNRKTTITEPIFFQSSNPAVLTIATNGNACAGSWDSLTVPQICTAGPVGVAQVTAFAKGVSSPPTTVYVHQRIDNITITPIPGQIVPASFLSPDHCFSKDVTFNFQATAYSGTLDITSTVGNFTWQAQNTSVLGLTVATQSNPITGLLTGQAQLTAKTPGVTTVFASASNVNSVPMDFTTCKVQSIALAVTGSSSNTVMGSSEKTVTATVVDSQGATLTDVPLSWCSSDPALVSPGSANCAAAATTGSFGSMVSATPKAGGATIIATCTPPNCNIGFQPSLPIYPENVVNFIFTPTTATPQSATVYVSSTQCGTNDSCVPTIIPVTAPANTLGTAINLPATPNSMVWDPMGTNTYLGTDFSFFGTRGLMKLGSSTTTGTSVTEFKSLTGKVLAISPDSKKVILSGGDPNAVPTPGSNAPPPPTQVTVFDTTSSTLTILPIVGATAAAFSPDSLKAYIVATNSNAVPPTCTLTGPPTCALYVYSTVDPLATIGLSSAANDVTFLANGAYAYAAGGVPSGGPGVTTFINCTNSQVTGGTGSVSTAATPSFLRSLPDASGILAVESPNIDLISVISAPVGCPPQPPTNTLLPPVNLGAGNFVPTQLIVTPDGTRAYVLTSNVGSVLVFDISSQSAPPPIGLTGGALALNASLTPDGTRLYVASDDGTVHVIDTQGAADIQQISFPVDPSNPLLGGFCTGVAFPLQSVVSITAASPSGPNAITYTYTLTSGPGLQIGASIVIMGMADGGNNGTFAVTALGAGTFTVRNANGVAATNQTGTGNVTISCNPDLIAVKP